MTKVHSTIKKGLKKVGDSSLMAKSRTILGIITEIIVIICFVTALLHFPIKAQIREQKTELQSEIKETNIKIDVIQKYHDVHCLQAKERYNRLEAEMSTKLDTKLLSSLLKPIEISIEYIKDNIAEMKEAIDNIK